jgi:hypothetical protein
LLGSLTHMIAEGVAKSIVKAVFFFIEMELLKGIASILLSIAMLTQQNLTHEHIIT